MKKIELDPRLRLIQNAQMKDRVVLVRVDHNVVKRGIIEDNFRIDSTLGTLYAIAEKGGRPILMTHIGRPRDKKTGRISCDETQSVIPIVRYLERKLPVHIHVPDFPRDPERGITCIDESIRYVIEDLRKGRIGMIYLPNSRWFQGEQSTGPEKEAFAKELAGLAELYINDAFGSWQAHASTYDIARLLPGYSGILLQKEILNTHKVLEPERPFVCVIAGAKYDTKIGPLSSLYERADRLILGGLIYNTFIATKYGVEVAGVSQEDKDLAKQLVDLDQKEKKILEMPFLVESDVMDDKIEGSFRTINIDDAKSGHKFNYLVDIHPSSLESVRVKEAIGSARTIFVNAVMGLMPNFFEGSQALYRSIASNRSAMKMFGGGDTLKELKNLCPGIYLSGLDSPDTYYFTGGGSVLTAIEQGSPYHLKPVEVLME